MTPPVTNFSSRDGYDPAFFQTLFKVEDSHFWFRSRNEVIASTVDRMVSDLAPGYQVLEIGCGTGNVLRVLQEVCSGGTVTGMDLFQEGLSFAKQRTSAALVQGDLHQSPFARGNFEVIGLFDVLEHLPDDMEVLSDLHTMLTDHGLLLLTVPAHPALWSYFDEASHHYRRYRSDELQRKLAESGFDVEFITQYMMSIFPLVWIGRQLSSFRNRMFRRHRNATSSEELASQELHPISVVNDMLSLVLRIEGCWLARGHTLPLGTSLLAVARKRR